MCQFINISFFSIVLMKSMTKSFIDDCLPITSKYLYSIANLIEDGFLLSTAATSAEEENTAASGAASVLNKLYPAHALLRAAVGILRSSRTHVEDQYATAFSSENKTGMM